MGIKEQTVSARTYADLIGIVALRIIEIGDQSARFGFLPPLSLSLSLFPFFLPFIPRVSPTRVPRARSHYAYVFANYATLRAIMRRIAAKEIGETLDDARGLVFPTVSRSTTNHPRLPSPCCNN